MKEDLGHMRENYTVGSLEESSMKADPMDQFQGWFAEAKESSIKEPNAMILSTSSLDGHPSARTILLKSLDSGFVFYTNYKSHKARELESNPKASALFLWKELERQVRVVGSVERVSREMSEKYFQSRPRGSQLGAWASEQSKVIKDRTVLEESLQRLESKYPTDSIIPCPPHWGGYRIKPAQIEFWQGKTNRLHDRILYTFDDNKWSMQRLSP